MGKLASSSRVCKQAALFAVQILPGPWPTQARPGPYCAVSVQLLCAKNGFRAAHSRAIAVLQGELAGPHLNRLGLI